MDANYVRYILAVIILDLSMGLFVPFAAVCPIFSPTIIEEFLGNRFGRMWMIICPNMDKK